ncbi:MAG: hypothetical protein IJ982_08360 [Fibrobacter sp.]|nr:hypothetical protein [Fibrobacter sp.]
MDNRYKITLSNDHIYREIELSPDLHRVKVGTGVDCDVPANVIPAKAGIFKSSS